MLGFFKFLYDKNFRVPVLLTNDTEHRVASTLEWISPICLEHVVPKVSKIC